MDMILQRLQLWAGISATALIILIVSVTWAYFEGKGAGAAAVRIEWAKANEAERARQAAAAEESRQFQQVEIEAWRAYERYLTTIDLENADEAARDPDAGRVSLSLGGVQRLNRIRREAPDQRRE